MVPLAIVALVMFTLVPVVMGWSLRLIASLATTRQELAVVRLVVAEFPAVWVAQWFAVGFTLMVWLALFVVLVWWATTVRVMLPGVVLVRVRLPLGVVVVLSRTVVFCVQIAVMFSGVLL